LTRSASVGGYDDSTRNPGPENPLKHVIMPLDITPDNSANDRRDSW